LLETVRQYGRDRLQKSGDAGDVQRRHCEWYLDLAERADTKLRGNEQDVWLNHLETEHENLRAALTWSKTAKDGAESWQRLAAALEWFWFMNGHWSEGRRWLEEALLAGEVAGASVLFKVTWGAARTDYQQGDNERARELFEQMNVLAERLGDKRNSILARVCMGTIVRELGESERGAALGEEGVTLAREFGDKWLLALSLAELAIGVSTLGDYERAEALCAESIRLFEEIGDKWRVSVARRNMGIILLHRRNYSRAVTFYVDSIRLRDPAKNGWVAYQSLEGLACIACARGHHERAAILFGAANSLQESLRSRRDRHYQGEVDGYMKAARTSLGEQAFASAWTEGRAMTLEQGIEYAFAWAAPVEPPGPRRRTTRPAGDALTAREREVAALVTRGQTNREIATTLVISERTADVHVHHILNTLGFSSRAQIAVWATERGLKAHLGD
jgi:non-specific serine/threonine protein kinase